MKKYIEPEMKVRTLDTEELMELGMSNTQGDGNQMSKEYDNWDDEEEEDQ